jgi:hypothetical protein
MPIAILLDIAGAPDAGRQLKEQVGACDLPPGGVDGPRIKVAIDPAKAIRDSGLTATVPFDASAVEQISPALEKQVRAFIELNRDVLMRYWRLDPSITSTKKFAELLRPIPIGE